MAEVIIEQIKPDLFRSEIPLPRNPLKATNSYLIKGEQRNLIIDTGMKRKECRSALTAALDKLGVELEKTDFFITHLHADHIGLADELVADDAVVYFNQPDAEVLNYKNLWQLLCTLAGRHGLSPDQVVAALDSHPGQRYGPPGPFDFTIISDGEVIRYGDYELKCVMTPGHTRGHTCLYEPELKMLFSGDHILGDITPNISTWLDDSNPLKNYFDSLDRVASLPVELVLPGHRRLIADCPKRIAELKEHHRRRLEEVMEILEKKGPGNAFAVASHMTWELVAAGWNDFPLMQKWFATGEALAHIRYLEDEGKVEREMEGETVIFSVV